MNKFRSACGMLSSTHSTPWPVICKVKVSVHRKLVAKDGYRNSRWLGSYGSSNGDGGPGHCSRTKKFDRVHLEESSDRGQEARMGE